MAGAVPQAGRRITSWLTFLITIENRQWKTSIYSASAVFLKTAPAFELKPGTLMLRLSLSPRAAKRYNIMDAWVMPH